MSYRGSLSLALFLYEIVRSAVLVAVLMFFSVSEGMIPHVALATPNALFAIMAFFLFIDGDRYRVFMQLYVSGKAIIISALIGWSISSFRAILFSPTLADPGTAAPIILTALLLPADVLSLVVAIKLGGVRGRGVRSEASPNESADGRIEAGDTFPGGR